MQNQHHHDGEGVEGRVRQDRGGERPGPVVDEGENDPGRGQRHDRTGTSLRVRQSEERAEITAASQAGE